MPKRTRFKLLAAGALLAGIPLSAAPKAKAPSLVAVFSSVKSQDCKTLDKGPSYLNQLCPGNGGYDLRVIHSDQMHLAVVSPDKHEHRVDCWGSFPRFTEPQVQWRLSDKNAPVALIIPVEISDMNKPYPYPRLKRLHVIKITPQDICVVTAVDPGPKQEAIAKQTADQSADLPCQLEKTEKP